MTTVPETFSGVAKFADAYLFNAESPRIFLAPKMQCQELARNQFP